MIRIDRYVLRQFILTAIFVLVGFMVLFVVVDMMENLDDFLDKHASVGIIALYYFYFLPEIINFTIPVCMLLSALFTTGRFSSFNELTAMKSSGMSLYRFMAPLLCFALLVSCASVYFNGWVVPFANKKKFEIGRDYFQRNIQYVARNNIFIQDSPSRILSVGFYDDRRALAKQISIQDFDPNDPTHLTARYDATEMRWNPEMKAWTLVNGIRRTFIGDREHAERFASFIIGTLNFSPEDIQKKQQRPEDMDYTELTQFIENQKRAGQDVSRWLVEHYQKVAFPMASIIVVLFGVPVSSIKRRSGLGVQFAIGLLVCFLYIVFLKTSQAFGYNGDLNPLLTAWMANIIFFVVGIFNLLRIPK